MELLTKISHGLDSVVSRIGRIAAWAGLLLIAVTLFDVITRRFLVLGSTKLQELEWHLHVVLFAFVLGYAYLKDSHVRIDLVRERLSPHARWWIELMGCVLFLIPYCALVIYFSYDFALRSFDVNEISASATGLSHRWIIKAAIPLGFALLALAGIAVLLRKIVQLFGPPNLRQEISDREAAKSKRLMPSKVEKGGSP